MQLASVLVLSVNIKEVRE